MQDARSCSPLSLETSALTIVAQFGVTLPELYQWNPKQYVPFPPRIPFYSKP
jgi:hypothetical protein